MMHDAHTHPGSMVSGVYYVKMPEDSGKIVFDDPRGNGRSPFDTQMSFEPQEGTPAAVGQSICFLVHRLSHISLAR